MIDFLLEYFSLILFVEFQIFLIRFHFQRKYIRTEMNKQIFKCQFNTCLLNRTVDREPPKLTEYFGLIKATSFYWNLSWDFLNL